MALRHAVIALAAAGALLGAAPALQAQETARIVTPDEIAFIAAAVAKIGCDLGTTEIERENDNLFEIDDVACEMGQFDIKLDASFMILTITNDGPVDHNAVHVDATAEEVAGVNAALAELGCAVGESSVEKETPDLFEIDDAQCTAGQFDIKLNGAFRVLSMTGDG